MIGRYAEVLRGPEFANTRSDWDQKCITLCELGNAASNPDGDVAINLRFGTTREESGMSTKCQPEQTQSIPDAKGVSGVLIRRPVLLASSRIAGLPFTAWPMVFECPGTNLNKFKRLTPLCSLFKASSAMRGGYEVH